MDIFLIWAFVLVILSLNQVFAEDAESFLEEFDTCRKDQSTGMKAYVEKHRSDIMYAGCILTLGGDRYCRLKCLFEKYGSIDEYDKPNIKRINSYVDEYPKFPEREAIRNASISCVSRKTYQNCRAVQEWYYCFYNEFTRICKIQRPPKSFNTESNKNDGLVDLGL